MTKRLTVADFMEKSILKHGSKYDYSKVTYVNNATKVEIVCNKHCISFHQTPAGHMAGRGCPLCRHETTSVKATSTLASFVGKAYGVHGNAYDYSRSVYTTTHTPLDILCKKHNHTFSQKPTNHLSGKGCPLCATEKIKESTDSLVLTTQEFVEKALATHGNLYDYTGTTYVRSNQKVDIWCNRHGGMFQQTPNSHLAGIGCASCAKTGYSNNKPGVLYVLVCGDITKIGISNLSASVRASTVSRKFGSEFSVKFEKLFEDGVIASDIETGLLRLLRAKYERPQAKFEGSSECFLNVDYEELVNLINKEIENLSETTL